MRSIVLTAVALVACGPLTPPASTGPEVQPPGETDQVSRLSVKALTSGGVVTLLRLTADTPLTQEKLTVPAGADFVEVRHGPGEALALAQAVSATVQQAGCTAVVPVSSAVLHVPQDFGTIQEAVDAAQPGDTVLVAPGTYTESIRLRSGVALMGSGAAVTTLDAQGVARTLVDFTDATGVTISGFTFKNVGRAQTCADDVFGCSGDWYAAAIYADGHNYRSTATGSRRSPCTGASAFIQHNVFESNDIAVMLYFHAFALVQNNVFVHNASAFIANHLQDVGSVVHNTFVANAGHSVGVSAGFVDVVNNIIVDSGEAYRSEFIQSGRVRCNLFFGNAVDEQPHDPGAPPRFTFGQDGNVQADPGFANPLARDFHLAPGSAAVDTGCSENGLLTDPDGTPVDLGAFGGASGQW